VRYPGKGSFFSNIKGNFVPKNEIMLMALEFIDPSVKSSNMIVFHGPPGIGKKSCVAEFCKILHFGNTQVNAKDLDETNIEKLFYFITTKSETQKIVLNIDSIENIMNDKKNRNLARILIRNVRGLKNNGNITVIFTTRLSPEAVGKFFDLKIEKNIAFDFPTKEEVRDLIDFYKSKSKNSIVINEQNLNDLADMCAYSISYADIKDIFSEAVLISRHSKNSGDGKITNEIITEAFLKKRFGPKLLINISNKKKYTTAIHESGHILGFILSKNFRPIYSSIDPRGDYAGITLGAPNNYGVADEGHAIEKVVCLLMGRAAEERYFNIISFGALDDIQKSRKIAQGLHDVCRIRFSVREEDLDFCLIAAHETAVEIISQNDEFMKKMSAHLYKKKEINSEGIAAISECVKPVDIREEFLKKAKEIKERQTASSPLPTKKTESSEKKIDVAKKIA
jgi:hypothetical protein